MRDICCNQTRQITILCMLNQIQINVHSTSQSVPNAAIMHRLLLMSNYHCIIWCSLPATMHWSDASSCDGKLPTSWGGSQKRGREVPLCCHPSLELWPCDSSICCRCSNNCAWHPNPSLLYSFSDTVPCVSVSLVLLKMISTCSGMPVCTPPHLSEVSSTIPLKQFHWLTVAHSLI